MNCDKLYESEVCSAWDDGTIISHDDKFKEFKSKIDQEIKKYKNLIIWAEKHINFNSEEKDNEFAADNTNRIKKILKRAQK